MNPWGEYKKGLGVVESLYEVRRHKTRTEELILLMRVYDAGVLVVKLGLRGPQKENISIFELRKEYDSTNESIAYFLNVATKKYVSAEKTRELILSIERPGLTTNLKEIEMGRKKVVAEPEVVAAPVKAVKAKKVSADTSQSVVVLKDAEKLNGDLLIEIGGWLKKRKNPPSRQQVLEAFADKGHPKVNVACCITAGVRSGALALQ